ncbi:unnamed protein product [Malus baccata var. baccata]
MEFGNLHTFSGMSGWSTISGPFVFPHTCGGHVSRQGTVEQPTIYNVVDEVLFPGCLPICPLCAWYQLRTRNVAIGIGVVSLDLQIWHFFPIVVTMMGSSCALSGGFSKIFCPLVVFTDSAAYTASEALFKVFRFFCVVTFGPLQLGLSFWAPM